MNQLTEGLSWALGLRRRISQSRRNLMVRTWSSLNRLGDVVYRILDATEEP